MFDIANSLLTVDGYAFVDSDYANGDPVTFSKDEDTAKLTPNAFGSEVVTKNHKGGGKIVVKVSTKTPGFKKLMTLANTTALFPVTLNVPGEEVSGTQAVILRSPNGSLSENAPVREFTIAVTDYKHDYTD